MQNNIMFLLVLVCFQLNVSAQQKQFKTENHLRSDWMKGKYGLMVHWLIPTLSKDGKQMNDLNQIVAEFDLDAFMSDFDKTGAEWLIFTIGQNKGFYSSPNSVIDSSAGSGHTSKRDLVLEIAKALKKRGKKFIAYIPCEVKGNPQMHAAFSWNTQPGTDQALFQEKYLRAIREYAVRYGKNLDGWWLDGCYTWPEFHNKYMKWDKWFDALRAGNREAVVTFNDGSFCAGITQPVVPELDYLSGEANALIDGKVKVGWDSTRLLYLPSGTYVEGTKCLNHVLLPIDCYWSFENEHFPSEIKNLPFENIPPRSPLYPDTELHGFVKNFTGVGGAVTLNVGIYQEGYLGEKTVAQMQRLKKALSKKRN